MEKLSFGQRRLIGEFLSNIGVAWFVAGVIGSFVQSPENLNEAIVSLLWGVIFSLISLRLAMYFVKGVES